MYLKNKNISIVGGGLVGSLLSIFLSKQGAKVHVFDKRPDIRLEDNIEARSINLALSDRGINALKKVGIDKTIMSIAMPMHKRVIHSVTNHLTDQYYGIKKQPIYSISRHDLNKKLIDVAEDSSVQFHFSKQCVDLDFRTTTLFFSDSSSITSDFIFGADGAGSMIRKKMSSCFSDFQMEEKFINSSYKELTIPADLKVGYKLYNKALHIWPRKSFMMIALPNLDQSFTCTLFAPNNGINSFETLNSDRNVNDFFSKQFNDFHKMVPDLVDQYFLNPTSSLGYVRCGTWKKENVMLIGDACHATVPFYGQGMNSGFEDCFLLNEWINENKNLFDLEITSFLEKRRIDTMAMQDLSMNNFIEMRDKTADSNFLLQKKIEQWFSIHNPKKWTPLYSMVTFSDIPYSEALKRGRVQDRIMKEIMIKNKLVGEFNVKELEEKNIERKILDKI